MLKITWLKSTIGHPKTQRLTMKSLGLTKLNQAVVKEDTPELRGQITKVQHLVSVEEL
ncbi:MAG: 50S ribosomal protein L30 [Ignavibacteriales bacterium]